MTKGCFCKAGAHFEGMGLDHIQDHMLAPWERDGIRFCAHGHEDGDVVWGIDSTRTVSLRQAMSDFYVLDALRWDMLAPRTPRKAKLTVTQRLVRADRWRDCCDTREGDRKHGPGCDGGQPTPGAVTPMSTDRAKTLIDLASGMDDRESVLLVTARAWTRREALVDEIAYQFRNYLHWAVSGELRYERSGCMNRSFPTGSGAKSEMRAGWFRFVQHVGAAKAAKYAKDLFENGSWQTSFGGKAWAGIADILWRFESGEWDAWLFVDRVFNAQHNTGTCLNKSSGIDDKVAWSDDPNYGFKAFLDAHHESDWSKLLTETSSDVTTLWEDYFRLANVERTAQGMEPVEAPEAKHTSDSGYYDANGYWVNECKCAKCKAEHEEQAMVAAAPVVEESVKLAGQDLVDVLIGGTPTSDHWKPKKSKAKNSNKPATGSLAEKIQQMQAEAMANMPEVTNDENVEDVW